jgi:nitroreductase
VLAIGIVEHRFEHNGKPNRTALHDLGAASAFLTLEATRRGLHVHQMAGIDQDAARTTFSLPESQEAVTGIAIGYLGDGAALDARVRERVLERERRDRARKPIAEFIVRGRL